MKISVFFDGLHVFNKNREQIKKLLLWICLLLTVDQATKLLAQSILENHTDIVLIPDLLGLHFLRNEIGRGYQYLYYFVVSIILFPAALLYSYAKSFPKLVVAGFTLLWSATLSNNIIDAFTLGYIRDFIDLHGIAVGNIADQYRNVGVVVVVAGLILQNEKKLDARYFTKFVLVALAVLTLMALFWKYLSRYLAI
jgi:signal peptidase II